MFAEFVKSALEFLKLAPRYLVAVVVIAGALLFFPNTWLERVGVAGFAKANRQWLGLAFLVSAVLWGIAVVMGCWVWARRRLTQRSVRRHVVWKLNSLTEDEKQILRYYLFNNTHANSLRIDDGVVQGLVTDHIIYRSSTMGYALDGFAHNITDYVWDYIHANPQVLQGTTDSCRTDKSKYF